MLLNTNEDNEGNVLSQNDAREIAQAILLYLIYKSTGHLEMSFADVREWINEKQPQASFIYKDDMVFIDVTSEVIN